MFDERDLDGDGFGRLFSVLGGCSVALACARNSFGFGLDGFLGGLGWFRFRGFGAECDRCIFVLGSLGRGECREPDALDHNSRKPANRTVEGTVHEAFLGEAGCSVTLIGRVSVAFYSRAALAWRP